MAKSVPIKWRGADTVTLRKAIGRFNYKRDKIVKNDPIQAQFQPSRARMKEITDTIKTRVDFNRAIKELAAYKKPGAEAPIITPQGVPTTKWQLKVLNNRVRRINKERAKLLEKLAPSKEKGNLHSVEELALNPKKGPETVSQSDWDSYITLINKLSSSTYYSSKNEMYKKNYLMAIDAVMGPLGDTIKRIVESLTPDQVVDALYSDPVFEIDYIYDPYESTAKIALLEEMWRDFAQISDEDWEKYYANPLDDETWVSEWID